MTAASSVRSAELPESREVGRLEADVRCRLSRQVYDFRLLFEGNGLVLRGRCRTYYAKQLAQHAVMQATALPILANQIEVPERPAAAPAAYHPADGGAAQRLPATLCPA